MPKWIHDRADHIRQKNPGMPKSQAFAIATQQSYAAKKAPKGYGTPQGRREAKQKYDDPKSHYEQKAKPKEKTSATHTARWSGFIDELEKISRATSVADTTKSIKTTSTLYKKPNLTSKPVTREPDPPAATLDHFSSARTLQPPPVTAAGS